MHFNYIMALLHYSRKRSISNVIQYLVNSTLFRRKYVILNKTSEYADTYMYRDIPDVPFFLGGLGNLGAVPEILDKAYLSGLHRSSRHAFSK